MPQVADVSKADIAQPCPHDLVMRSPRGPRRIRPGPQRYLELRVASRRYVAYRHRTPVHRRVERPEPRTASDHVLVQGRSARNIDAVFHEQAQGHEVQAERLVGGATRALGMLHRVGVDSKLAQIEQRRHAVQVGQHPLVGRAAWDGRRIGVGLFLAEGRHDGPAGRAGWCFWPALRHRGILAAHVATWVSWVTASSA